MGVSKVDIKLLEKANTKKIAKKVEYYKEISSTHTYAKEIAADISQNGKLIFAEVQTAGIGTNGRNWYTGQENNIAMTLIVHPRCSIEKLEGLTLDIAHCMKDAIKELYGYDLTIKEPNDLMLNGKKISGILTQISTQSEKIKYLLISIGFNVNEEKFSDETKDIATSLKREFVIEHKREDIIIKFLEKLEKQLIRKEALENF